MTGFRAFFAVCLLVALGLLVAASLGAVSAANAPLPPQAADGMRLWSANRCQACHTLYGQGGAYAPDLTHIAAGRGADYLREFFANPGAFHPGQRPMPRFGLTRTETDALIAFLTWTGEQAPATAWPPHPILVSGGLSAGTAPVVASASTSADDAAARGRALFSSSPAICSTCHALVPDVVVVGPSLASVANRAGNRVTGLSAEEYLRNSILHPGDFVVPGFQDVMQKNFGSLLTSDQISDLVAFLLTLR